MLRLFETHHVRKEKALSGHLWKFSPLDGEERGHSSLVIVPSCWETYPGFENYKGRAAYETSFEAAGNIRLEFKGVSHYAKVLVDGLFIGEHYCSYTPFSCYVRNLYSGRHDLRVEVDNSFKPEYSQDIPNDYMSYGGISRGVLLEEVPDATISVVHFTPLVGENGIWKGQVEVYCKNLSDTVLHPALRIHLSGTEVMKDIEIIPGDSLVYSEILEFKGVESWTIESPVLHDLTVQLFENGIVSDDLIDRIGFRTVKAAGQDILLNGKAVYIKGFCRHEDHPHYGCALPKEAIASDLMLAKDMGANSIRTSHYPNDELFLDLCDEMGFIVWEENHARGLELETMMNPLFEKQAESVIREMITAHYNHPSIYLWGILNECASETEYGRTCYSAQYNLIRSLDSSRLCSSASCKFYTDLCQDLPDICSWNIYPYWYDDESPVYKIDHFTDWINEHGGKGKPFLISEIGAGGIYGFRGPAHDIWSEELQEEILGKQISEVYSSKKCTGLYLWQFCDVRVDRGWGLRRPKSRNNKGVVDEYRRPKLAYQTVKRLFSGIPNYKED